MQYSQDPFKMVYSPKKKSQKYHEFSFVTDFYSTKNEVKNWGQHQFEREDSNLYEKNPKLPRGAESYKQFSSKSFGNDQTSKSLIVSQKQHRLASCEEQTSKYMTNSGKLPFNRSQKTFHHQFQNFSKKNQYSVQHVPMEKYLQMAKREKERNIPTYTIMYNSKISKYVPKPKNFVIEELRETEDTITNDCDFFTSSYPLPKASDFHQVKLLGKGKNGQVYLAIHKVTGFACAMKIIKKKDINKGTKAERDILQNQLMRQIKVQLFMSDPNLIQLYCVFSDKQNIYLIQELGIDGQLYDLMRKRTRLSEQSTALVSREILKGIKAMHEKNIIHRDLKPENIVLIYGIAKLCDFGWSIHCPLQMRSTLCGTPLYLSPQILIGDDYNQKIDIWAFGTLVYELFTGDNPFNIKSRCDLKKIVTEQLQFANNFPRRLRSFLQFVLKKKSFERPTASQIECHEFLKKYAELQTSEELACI